MNELTTEQMEERIRNVKEHYSNLFAMEDHVIVIGSGNFHNELAQRLQRMADKISTPLHIVTPDELKGISSTVNQPLEDILNLIDQLAIPKTSTLGDDLKKLAEIANDISNERESLQYPIIDNDDRPWYEKAASKGGNKRKQNYNNRQPWKR